MRAAHNTLRAHGQAVQVIRARAKIKSVVGWAPCGKTCIPATGKLADINAARQGMFKMTERSIWQPLDFFGVNIYNGELIRTGKGGQP